MYDVIQILGERWSYVYSSMFYGEWSYNKETKMLSTTNEISFDIKEIEDRIAELELEYQNPNADPAISHALVYLYKIKEKIG
jgi:hypothetical protein